MKVIHKVVVGSRLHGLANENSDYDYRGIFVNSLRELSDPFSKRPITHWFEGDEDNTMYELGEFCKRASKGENNSVEILFSNNIVETSEIGKTLVANKEKFLNSSGIYNAFKGYAHNQLNKMNLFDPDDRTPKFAVAYIRVLLQGTQLLKTGTMNPQVPDEWKQYLLDVKHEFDVSMIPELSKKFQELQVELLQAYANNRNKYTPDIEWIKEFIYESYKKEVNH